MPAATAYGGRISRLVARSRGIDIALIGHLNEPWRRNFSDVRIMRDVTPSINIRYVLTEKSKRARSDEETLTGINYQMNPSARLSSDRYTYEKTLLDDWFHHVVGRQRHN